MVRIRLGRVVGAMREDGSTVWVDGGRRLRCSPEFAFKLVTLDLAELEEE